MEYFPRIVDDIIKENLEITGCCVIKGPKCCGKKTSARQIAESVIEFQDPIEGFKYQQIAENNTKLLLAGEKPRLIVEWQLIPNIWNAIRRDVDNNVDRGLYIITGSVTPIDIRKYGLHSGIGRMSFVNMYPMSLYESKDSNGSISLKEVLEGTAQIDGNTSDITYERLAYLTCRGGWPSSISSTNEEDALKVAKDYLDGLCESILEIDIDDDYKLNPLLIRAIIRAYSRLVCTIETNRTFYNDVRQIYGDVSDNTIMKYLNRLKRLYVIEDVIAWNPGIISNTNMKIAPKKTLIDSSIACAALELSPAELANDPILFGLLFENLVNRDLKVYASKLGVYLSHYQDRYGLECNQVIHFDNGEYGLIQTKLGTKKIVEACHSLIKLRDKLRAKNRNEPKFMMIITVSNMAYTTRDGILIVPIGCLKD